MVFGFEDFMKRKCTRTVENVEFGKSDGFQEYRPPHPSSAAFLPSAIAARDTFRRT